MLALCRLSPVHTCRHASVVAPTTWAAASCIAAKTGLSSLPSPYAGTNPTGSAPARLTASIRPASCRVAIRSSPAMGAATVPSRSRTARSRASRMVRSTRTGDIGWLGPKSYSVSDGSKTTVAGPAHGGMRRRLPVPSARADDAEPLLVARLTADPDRARTLNPTAAHGRPFLVVEAVVGAVGRASTTARGPSLQEPTMDRNLSLITPTGRLTLGNHLGALRRFVAAQDAARTPDDCFF